MVGHLRVGHLFGMSFNFYFTNHRHGRFARYKDHRQPPQLLQM